MKFNVLSLTIELFLAGIVTSQRIGSWSSVGGTVARIGGGGPLWNSIGHTGGSSSWRHSSGGGSTRHTSSRRPPVPDPERLIGSSIFGRPLRMGELGLPRHGGAGIGRAHANGMRDGWDGNPSTLGMFHHRWTDPLGGRPLPPGWNGDFNSISHLFMG